MTLTRRALLAAALPAAAGQRTARFFSTVQQRGRWWFLTPQNRLFFSLGLNHIDSSTLRYPENLSLWRNKYGGSQRRWLEQSVAPDLNRWGFNTVGWTQEVVIRTPTIHRHCPPFTLEEYHWLGLPYCHLLPFVEFHQWEYETRYPDFFSKDFEEWCDFVARNSCARMANDPKLIGYFYSDCPTWVHTRNPRMKAPLFDPLELQSEAGRKKLFALATRYYQVTHAAIRRYDKNHLILGDRYEAKAPLPEEVLHAAVPFVDVFSFQYFDSPENVRRDFLHWHALTRKPVLLADSSSRGKDAAGAETGRNYAAMLGTLRQIPGCIGFHYCGAYLTNRARRYGLRDEQEKEFTALTDAIRRANLETERWTRLDERHG